MAVAGFGHDIHVKLTKLIQGILEQDLGVDPGRCHCVVGICSSPILDMISCFQTYPIANSCQANTSSILDFVEICGMQFQEQVHANWGCGGDILANRR